MGSSSPKPEMVAWPSLVHEHGSLAWFIGSMGSLMGTASRDGKKGDARSSGEYMYWHVSTVIKGRCQVEL